MSNSLRSHGLYACQAPLTIVFPRQEYWSRLPFPFPGHLPCSGTEATSSALAGGFFTVEPPGKPDVLFTVLQNSGKLCNQMHQNFLITQAWGVKLFSCLITVLALKPETTSKTPVVEKVEFVTYCKKEKVYHGVRRH